MCKIFIDLYFYKSHKEGVNFGYLCIGPSQSHPSPLGWEIRDASRQWQDKPLANSRPIAHSRQLCEGKQSDC